MPEKCHATNCSRAAVAKGLCDTHRKRKARHGHLEDTRASDWGSREKHPAYVAWCNLRRHHKSDMEPSWRDDFWAFARAVPEKPSGWCQAQRPDPSEPWGPGNFYWKEPRRLPADRADKAEYMRKWQAASRAANPDYGKDADLRRNYGVTLEWYRAKFDEQGGVCAICAQEETAVIRGKRISLAVDHCHDTGKVRGLLCRACNNAIGAMKHDPNLLKAAVAYLED